VQIIPRDRLALVLAGPERADTIWWWRLRTDAGVEGWGNQDEMTPDPGPCAFGTAGSTGGPTPPYPVTILPSFSFEQPPASEPSSVQVAPPAQTTPAQQETLPQTGGSVEWWFWAALLAIVVIVVGVVRRRLQTQSAVSGRSLRDDETEIKKQ
jgi:LPXTG-motif cell wall-anchored protein